MTKKAGISLHPRLAAALEVIASLIFYALLMRQTNAWLVLIVLLGRVLWWGALTQFTFYPEFRSRLNHWCSLIFFNFSSAGLFFLLTTPYARDLLVIGATALCAGSFFLIPPHSDVVLAIAKPERRLRWLMALVTVAGMWATIFGLSTFQTITGWQRLVVSSVGVVITAVISVWWWHEYEHITRPRQWLGAGVLVLCLVQFVYTLYIWPLGYVTNAFFITWLWYILWMLIRFYFSKDGIRWQQHAWTLGLQAALFVSLLLFVVRWR